MLLFTTEVCLFVLDLFHHLVHLDETTDEIDQEHDEDNFKKSHRETLLADWPFGNHLLVNFFLGLLELFLQFRLIEFLKFLCFSENLSVMIPEEYRVHQSS